MKHLRIQFFLLFIFCCALCIPRDVDAGGVQINHVRFGVHKDKTRIVLELNGDYEFKAFTLENPNRIVVDLPSFNWAAGIVNPPPESGITALRYGNLTPYISRIVFDVNGAGVIKTAFFLPAQGGNSPRLVVDFSTSRSAGGRSNPVFGDLNEQRIDNNASGPIVEPVNEVKKPPAPPPQKREKPLIVIDAGHGGVDPGAISAHKTYEKDTVLAIARALKTELEQTGRYRVHLTRDEDVFLKLGTRRKIAHDLLADLFISIHADTIDKKDVRGASIYTLSDKASDAQSAKLAANENRADLIAGIDLSGEDAEVANILLDLSMRDTMNQSRFFAGKIVDAFKAGGVKTLQTPHRYAGFAVLKAPDVPAVLIEAGFLSNAQEARMLNSPEYRGKLTRSIRNGIDSYFDHIDGE